MLQRERGKKSRATESDEESNKRDKQIDRERKKGKQVHVETHTRNKLKIARPGWRDKDSGNNTRLDGDECSFTFGSMLTA